MRLLIDMNLSPRWVGLLNGAGIERGGAQVENNATGATDSSRRGRFAAHYQLT